MPRHKLPNPRAANLQPNGCQPALQPAPQPSSSSTGAAWPISRRQLGLFTSTSTLPPRCPCLGWSISRRYGTTPQTRTARWAGMAAKWWLPSGGRLGGGWSCGPGCGWAWIAGGELAAGCRLCGAQQRLGCANCLLTAPSSCATLVPAPSALQGHRVGSERDDRSQGLAASGAPKAEAAGARRQRARRLPHRLAAQGV